MDDLRLAVERAILAKVQVSEVAKLVERNDVGDFGGFGLVPASAERSSQLQLENATNGAVPTWNILLVVTRTLSRPEAR